MAWHQVQWQGGSPVSMGTTGVVPDTGSNGLTFGDGVTEGDIVFVVVGQSAGFHVPAITSVTDMVGTDYHLFWESNNASHTNIHVYAGLAPATGVDAIQVNFAWTEIYDGYPPYHSSVWTYEYSGLDADFSRFKLLDFAHGPMITTVDYAPTGSTSGVSADGYTTSRDVIMLSVACNTGTAEINSNSWIRPGMEVTDDVLGPSSPIVTVGEEILPYYADLMVFGVIDAPSTPKANRMFYWI